MPTKLSPGVPVKTGNTVWMIAPSNYVQVRLGDLTVGFTKVKSVNYALYHCGIPIISDLVIRNKGPVTSPPLMLSISIKGYSQPWHKHFDPLAPGGKFALNKIHLNLDYEKLEGNEGWKKASLNLQLNDVTIFTEEIHILGFFEWATDQVCRKSLACFVQPSHPVVQNIVLDAVGYLKESPGFTHLLKTGRSDKAECALRALYECLRGKYQIHYVLEPVSFEAGAQVIRPAQRVMSETRRGRGKGTCIDLTLLLASCLENIRLQPLIIFVKEEWPYQHAFLGCWKQVAERFRPIVTEIKDMDNEQIVFLESTGVTDRWGKKLTYDEAVKKAGDQFCQERFLFAVDIAGARQTVVPLQFPMSPGAIGILREAEALARKEKSAKLETGHLLRSLLLDEDKEINEILEEAGAEIPLTLCGALQHGRLIG